MADNDSIKKTIIVTLVLCIVCSIIVSTAAVMLKPAQVANKQLDFNKNILSAAGLYDEATPVAEQFAKYVTPRIVDLRTGKYSTDVSVEEYDQRKGAKDPKLSVALDKKEDIAGIKREEFYAKVYLVNENGKLSKIILPIRGYGLWSILYGFIALESDLQTVVGLGYYEHGETPGLGGEVDNPNWKAQWPGKKVYGQSGDFALSVIKGKVGANTPGAASKVDGLSGATLTTNGVDNMINYWLNQKGYTAFLKNLKAGDAES